MTQADFIEEYLRREAYANRRPEGADPKRILTTLAKEHRIDYETAREWILADAAGIRG